MNRRGLFSFIAAAPLGGAMLIAKPNPEPETIIKLPPAQAGRMITVVNTGKGWISISQ